MTSDTKVVAILRHAIQSNRERTRDDPVFQITHAGQTFYARTVEASGPFRFTYSPGKPLITGKKASEVWFETEAELILTGIVNEHPLKGIAARADDGRHFWWTAPANTRDELLAVAAEEAKKLGLATITVLRTELDVEPWTQVLECCGTPE
ncbi:MAG: hypothetical protein U1E62_21610 [Alsobacter sp.]